MIIDIIQRISFTSHSNFQLAPPAMVRGPAATASVWAPAPSSPMVFLMLGTGKVPHKRNLLQSKIQVAASRYDLTDEEAYDLGRRSIYHATHRDAASGGIVRLNSSDHSTFKLLLLYQSVPHEAHWFRGNL